MADVSVTYVGIHDEVDVPALYDLQGVKSVVKQGESVTVPADIAKSLLDQPDNWTAAKPSKNEKE